uniref:ABC transporter permease n=1 Tax=Dictyoglomus turgidum TaxID=513050 RepID=A0A7C3SMD1_9BACT
MKEASKEKKGILKTIRMQEIGILIILFVLCLFLSLTTETFLTSTNIFNILRAFSWIAISGFGILMVIITGGIDLSVGSVMAMAGLITAMMLKANFGVFLSIIGGILIGALIGFINGLLISKTNLPPFIATLGTMNIARGFCYGITGGWPIRDLPRNFNILGQYDIPFLGVGIPLPVVFMIILGIITSIFLNRTSWGYRIYAVGGNEQAARLSGINTGRVKILVYVLSGVLTAIGGILMTARLGVAAPTAATGYELDVIAAAVIGGASLTGGEGTVLGVIIGAAIMQVLRTGMVLLGFPAYWQPSAIGAIIIAAIIFDQYRKKKMGIIR